ncbi:MAG: Zn2+/Cd2+-exporting ATPase [Acetobacteraceae bacterium]|nr:Zn2+/Cd2+-exporting ATPase [Acetobacteraceae bacterium]
MDSAVASATSGPTPLRYRVDGMDCPSCASKIETALKRLGGGEGILVNYQSQTLALRLDEASTPRAAIENQIRSLGYDVSLLEAPSFSPISDPAAAQSASDAAAGVEPWWRTRKAVPLLAIGALLILGYLLGQVLPEVGGWPELPAALLGLWFAGGRAVALARAGSPFSIEMLMSIATVGAVLIGATAEAGVVVFLFTAGELMEGIAAGRARAGIQALTALVPRTAWLIEGEDVRQVAAVAVQVGQMVLVRPGDRVSMDGTVVEGASELDESPVTGESVPVVKREGDMVLAGSVNGSGVLRVRATRAAADNTIARIVHMVEEAQASRAPTARFIERFSAIYTPVVVAVALLTVLVPPLAFGEAWETWLYRGLALLLIGCPCALVLSTPAAITSGIAAGARRGLLIKSGAALEMIGRVRAVAFDKTGTLTRGQPMVTDVVAFAGTERSVLGLAASVENGSSHPIARAILERAAADAIPLRPATNARTIPGHAATATITGKQVVVGSPRFAAQQSPLPADIDLRVSALEGDGKTVVLVLSDGQPSGLLALRDEPRADAATGLTKLRELGIRPVMLTGDNRRAADAIGTALGIEARSELLPDDKLREITALKAQAPVAMVGDGINDAPALATASVGIAMGGGTDVALETADAALLGGRVTDVAALVRLSQATMRNIHQNVAIALGLKAVFLVTTLVGITGLWPAILADTGATVIVTMNALRLLRYR